MSCDIAARLHDARGDHWYATAAEVFAGVPADAPQGGDKEAHIDGLVERCRSLLGAEVYRDVFDLGLNAILDDIRDDLAGFGVHYQHWFSERTLRGGCGEGHRAPAGKRPPLRG